MSVARLAGDGLRGAGVRYVFGHPGGEVVDLIEGFREAGVEFVLARHETAAAFMAEAIASATGVPGVCVGTLGPGATNLVTGVAHAWLDRGPLLAFTGQLPHHRYTITTHQKIDTSAVYAPITKWQATLTSANAPAVIERALRVALARLLLAAAPEPKLPLEDLRAFRDAFTARVRPERPPPTAQQVLAGVPAAHLLPVERALVDGLRAPRGDRAEDRAPRPRGRVRDRRRRARHGDGGARDGGEGGARHRHRHRHRRPRRRRPVADPRRAGAQGLPAHRDDVRVDRPHRARGVVRHRRPRGHDAGGPALRDAASVSRPRLVAAHIDPTAYRV